MSYPISVNIAVVVGTIIPTLLLFQCRSRKFQGTILHFLIMSGLTCFLLAIVCRGMGFFSPTLLMVAFFATIGLFIVSLTVDSVFGPSKAKPIIWCSTGIIGLAFMIWFDGHFLSLNSLLKKHPLVSLDERLKYETDFRVPIDFAQFKVSYTGRLDLERGDISVIPSAENVDLRTLSAFERSFADDVNSEENRRLNRSQVALLAAHHGIEQQFRISAGFGRERTYLMPYRNWRLDVPESPSVRTQRPTVPTISESLVTSLSKPENVFAPWHQKNLISFVASPSLGVVAWGEKVSDLSRTVGFQEHSVRNYPDTSIQTEGNVRSFRIDSMLLVSLLKARPPAVYVSENLPNMKELAAVPTRQPNSFELEALNRLSAGEDLVVQCEDSQIQMVGSIRAAFQCLECHQVPRGTLLGAFTYRLSLVSSQEAEGLQRIVLSDPPLE